MTTLDEVIEALGFCCDMTVSDCGSCKWYKAPDCEVQNDALEYLKRYKADLEKKCSNCKNWRGHKNYDPNDPWREEYYCKWGLWSYPDDSCARWEEML